MSEVSAPSGRLPVGLTIASAIGIAILIGLGVWQWFRLGEKEAFLAGLERAATATPQPLPAHPPEFMRVTVTGRFLPGPALPVRATLPAAEPGKSLGGLGFWWLVPFRTDDGRVVLVNRGFVPARPDTGPPALETATDEQSLTGIVRAPDHGNFFLPNDNPATRDFFRRDPALLAAPLGMALEPAGPLAPFTIDAERQGSALQAPVGLVVADLIASVPNNHLGYAFTWWGLAATLAGVYIAYVAGLKRRARGAADSTAGSV